MLGFRQRSSLLLFRKHYECVGGPLNMKGTGRSISHEQLITSTVATQQQQHEQRVSKFDEKSTPTVPAAGTEEPMRVHCLQGYISSLYLVQYPQRAEWLLLDTGMPSDVERVQSFIGHVENSQSVQDVNNEGDHQTQPKATETMQVVEASAPQQRKVPRVVISSHCHVDHLGAGHRWAKRGAQIAVPKDYEAYYSGVGGRTQEAVDAVLALLVAHRLGRRFESPFSSMWRHKLTSAEHPRLTHLDDGQAVPHFSDWIALKCPGHTDHMIVMYHPHSQVLYVADFVVAPRRMRFQAPVPIDIDFAYRHSIERLRNLKVRFALLAHGGIVNVEDVPGGWGGIMDRVLDVYGKAKSRKAAFRLIEAMMGFATSPRRYKQEQLPTGALPNASPDARVPLISHVTQ